MRLNNGFEIPQIGVGTWTLRGETAKQNVCLAVGKKAFDMSLQDLPKEKLVLVFHSADGKATANIDLTK